MSTVIKIENLSKKYVIGHQRQEKYTALRDVMMHKLRSVGQRFRHPLSPNREDTNLEEFWALKNINLEIKQGDRVGIIGRNGAGKSTLLKILSRITEPTTGRMTINGRIASLLEVGTGFHPELTGRENIFLNGAILGMGRVEIKKKFDEIVNFAEVEKFLDTPVKRYSSGMYVRLAFAVAAHLEPEILVVDEVLAVGDVAFQKKCLGKMGEVSKEGRTILFVSHNMNAIQELCDRAVLLANGRTKQDNTVQSVIAEYLSNDAAQTSLVNLNTFARRRKHKYCRLTRFALMNNTYSLTTHFTMGDSLFAQVEVEIFKYTKNVEIGVKISSQQGTAIHYLTSSWEGFSKNLDSGVHIFEMCLPNLLLFPGKYQIGLWILREGEWSDDHVQEVTFFDVIKGDVSGFPTRIEKYVVSGCEVYAPCSWKTINTWEWQ